MARELHCGDVIEGCDHVIRGETEDEVFGEGAAHAREAHGVEKIDEETAARVRDSIREA